MAVFILETSASFHDFCKLVKTPESTNTFDTTLSPPRVPKIKTQDEFQISFCKLILKYKKDQVKVLLKRFHLNGHTIGFHPQTQKLESP